MTDTFTIAELRDRLDACDSGCSCHLSPPCAFCVSLTEEEVDAHAVGRVGAVRRLRADALAAAEDAAAAEPHGMITVTVELKPDMDAVAMKYGVTREPGETDDALHARILATAMAREHVPLEDAIDEIMPFDDVEMDYAPTPALSLTFAGEAQDLAVEILAHIPPGVTVWIDGRDYAIGAVDGTILRCRVVGADGLATDEAIDLDLADVETIHVY